MTRSCIHGLETEQRIPSRTTLYRHRLSIHIAYCITQRRCHEKLLGSPGGALIYSTVDSSPQGGWDWVMHGHRAIAAEDLVACFRTATTMINGGADADEAFLARALPGLRDKLKLVQGSPTAVGSGKSSLRRKAHALLHATRLVTDSWQSAIRLMNSTLSFTGDMGVESGLWTFVEDARSLMGN